MPRAPDPPVPSVADAPASAPPGSPPSELSAPPPRSVGGTWFRDLLEVLLIALVLYAVIWTCVETVRVDGTSMTNTLQNGDFLIASKISYILGSPQRGDIVILDPPHSCGDTTADYVKRVLGLPGDRIDIVTGTLSQPTRLYVQPGGSGPWDVVEEPYLPDSWQQEPATPAADGSDAIDHPLRIPPGMYFVLGDNRNGSCDSRVFGLVARSRILAKAIFRIWPLSSFGGLGPGPSLVTSAAPPSGAAVVGGVVVPGVGPLGRGRIARELRRARARRTPEL
jgi:signal peptidase I